MTLELHPVIRELTPLIKRVRDFNPGENIGSAINASEVMDDAFDIIKRVKDVMI
jgi:hypothetical protein